MITRDITVNGKTAQGFEIPLPNAMLVVAVAPKGYVMCGYLSLEAADKFNDVAAVVKGIKNTDELLAGKVAAVSPSAQKLGISVGMSGADALAKMF